LNHTRDRSATGAVGGEGRGPTRTDLNTTMKGTLTEGGRQVHRVRSPFSCVWRWRPCRCVGPVARECVSLSPLPRCRAHVAGAEITRGEHMAKNTWLNEYGGGLRQTDDTNAVPSRAGLRRWQASRAGTRMDSRKKRRDGHAEWWWWWVGVGPSCAVRTVSGGAKTTNGPTTLLDSTSVVPQVQQTSAEMRHPGWARSSAML
jgi:hypothetical protein